MPDPDSPFAVPEHRRHLRHAFYLRHPGLDQRSEAEVVLDDAAWAARTRSLESAVRERSARTLREVLDREDPLDVYGLVDDLTAACRVLAEDVEYPERLPVRLRVGYDPAGPSYAVYEADPVRGDDGRPYLRLRLGIEREDGDR